jgi:hypothetical protein
MPGVFSSKERALLAQQVDDGTSSIATSRIARDGGLPVSCVSTASFLTVFAAAQKFAVFHHQESSGTSAGALPAGAWTTRPLNTEVANTITGCSLAANRVTLPSGVYWLSWTAPGILCDNMTTRLYNVTAAAAAALGSAEVAVPSCHSHGAALVTLTGASALEVQQWALTARAGDGMGAAASSGQAEVYCSLTIVKVG